MRISNYSGPLIKKVEKSAALSKDKKNSRQLFKEVLVQETKKLNKQ